ncbi:LOW QUALITY PROTEIN: arsenate reductase, glutathione/glutaredoxin type, partial [Streptomyces sp. C]
MVASCIGEAYRFASSTSFATPSVLFVCVHDAGRSQMAAAFLTHLGGTRVQARSAGSAPADTVNPAVVQALAEAGIDISAETPEILTGRGDHHGLRATPAPTTPASATWTGSSKIRPGRASRPSGRSATRSSAASAACSPHSIPTPAAEGSASRCWKRCSPPPMPSASGRCSPASSRRTPPASPCTSAPASAWS